MKRASAQAQQGFPIHGCHERSNATEARVAGNLYVVFTGGQNHNSPVDWAAQGLPPG